MARTYTPERLDDMTLTSDELSKFNYYCFVEWGVNLETARRIFHSGLKVRERSTRVNKKRYQKRKQQATAEKALGSPSSTDSETKQRLIDTARRIRKALTPPTSPPKTPTFVDVTPPDTPAPPDSYPPTPSPGVIPRIVPTGMGTSDYITK